MPDSFHCSLVTPSAALLDEAVTFAAIPAHDGQVGVMPGRAPLMLKLGEGELRLDFAEGGSRWFYLSGGFAQMKGQRLTLLTTEAVEAANLVRQDAEASLKEARARRVRNLEEADRRTAEVARAKTLLHLADRVEKGV